MESIRRKRLQRGGLGDGVVFGIAINGCAREVDELAAGCILPDGIQDRIDICYIQHEIYSRVTEGELHIRRSGGVQAYIELMRGKQGNEVRPNRVDNRISRFVLEYDVCFPDFVLLFLEVLDGITANKTLGADDEDGHIKGVRV